MVTSTGARASFSVAWRPPNPPPMTTMDGRDAVAAMADMIAGPARSGSCGGARRCAGVLREAAAIERPRRRAGFGVAMRGTAGRLELRHTRIMRMLGTTSGDGRQALDLRGRQLQRGGGEDLL